jgi:hypothetical protein
MTGRPSDYRDEFATQAEKLAKLGATDMEVADFFEVSVRTINRWKITQSAFCQALKEGKEEADAKVVRSLFQRATGFEHDSVKVSFDKEGTPQYAPFREFVVPDTTACIFWLKNRKKDEWREKSEVEVTGNLAERIRKAEERVNAK